MIVHCGIIIIIDYLQEWIVSEFRFLFHTQTRSVIRKFDTGFLPLTGAGVLLQFLPINLSHNHNRIIITRMVTKCHVLSKRSMYYLCWTKIRFSLASQFTSQPHTCYRAIIISILVIKMRLKILYRGLKVSHSLVVN